MIVSVLPSVTCRARKGLSVPQGGGDCCPTSVLADLIIPEILNS